MIGKTISIRLDIEERRAHEYLKTTGFNPSELIRKFIVEKAKLVKDSNSGVRTR